MDLAKYAKDLQGLLDLMQRNDLAELEIEGEGHKIRLRKSAPPGLAMPAFSMPFPGGFAPALAPAAAGVAPLPAGASAPGPGAAAADLHVVRSPLVGTFYRASSPEAEPFVAEGDRVEPDTVLCIVEAMKVMNEIEAGVAGVVREILVGSGEAIEFGEPLFRIEPIGSVSS